METGRGVVVGAKWTPPNQVVSALCQLHAIGADKPGKVHFPLQPLQLLRANPSHFASGPSW